MRHEISNVAKVRLLMRRLGERATGPGRVYLVGGASAALVGWREMNAAVDLKLDPEPGGVFEAIAHAKEELHMKVELAAPDDFIPPLPGWRERSPFVARHGVVDFHHYDFYAQALAKIERDHAQDLQDVAAMRKRGLIEPRRLVGFFRGIKSDLLRFPAIDAGVFADKVRVVAEELEAKS